MAVESLQSLVGQRAVLRVETSGEEIIVSNQETDAAWSFHPVEVGRLNRNRVAHRVNKIENLNRQNANTSGAESELLLLSEHVTAGAGEFLRGEGISYLDASGNCFLKSGYLLLFIEGQRPKSRSQSKSSHSKISSDPERKAKSIRAFNPSGLKLIFALLVREDVVNWPYRDLAGLVDISRGTVGYVMRDLKELGFVEERKKKRHLRKREDLIDRWATGYTERLRSKLSRGRFQFLSERKSSDWESQLSNLQSTEWGGEPGADMLTGNFHPKLHTLYTREETSEVCRKLKVAPDPEGSLEILEMFWEPVMLQGKENSEDRIAHVPPLLIYADLIASADARARRIAKKIWNRYLLKNNEK